MPRRRGAFLLLLTMLVVVSAVFWWRPALRFLAEYPDVGRPPVKADAVVVLAGGWHGERILKAGELIRAGYAPKALVSSPSGWYELPECEAATRLAAKRGYPGEYFECVPVEGTSTREELAELATAVRARGLKRVLLVSVSTHLRRASTLAREAMPDVLIVPVAAEPMHYETATWYASREGRKAIFMEWVKLVTSPFGI
jgi:uncharacterized SAM-binding protein YcdF (DUF218 family)